MDRRVKERLVGASILVVLVVLFVPELLSGPKPAVIPPAPAGSAAPMRSVTIDLATSKATAGTDPAATPGAAGATISGEPATATSAETPDDIADAPGGGASTNAAVPGAGGSGAGGSGTGGSGTGGPGAGATMTPPATSSPPAASPGSANARAQQSAADALERGPASPTTARPGVKPLRRGWAAQIGSFAARDNAEKLERQLRSQGFSAAVSATGTGQALRYRVRVGPVADRSAAEKLAATLGKAGHPATLVAP